MTYGKNSFEDGVKLYEQGLKDIDKQHFGTARNNLETAKQIFTDCLDTPEHKEEAKNLLEKTEQALKKIPDS